MPYEITGDNIHMPNWAIDEKKLTIKMLREGQQKRLMSDPDIKKKKNENKLSHKNYKCPLCETEGHDCLQAAHVGQPIMQVIKKIVEENWDITNGNFAKLFNIIIEYEKKYKIKVCCRKCNKSLES